MLEEEGDLYCIWSPTGDDVSRLEISAGDFNVLMLQKEIIGDIVDWYTVDGDKDSSRPLTKGTDEINDILDCRWSGICVMSGWNLW